MKIKVLIVEDSPIAQIFLKKIINSASDLEVVGEAKTGAEALNLIPKLNPDVICTDLYMPKMEGKEFIQQVMDSFPRPILVISVAVQIENRDNIFQVLEAGAVDIFPKPLGGLGANSEKIKQELINKIRVLSGVKVFTKRKKTVSAEPKLTINKVNRIHPQKDYSPKIVTIGASTGGPKALQEILSALPANFSLPVVCIQHISDGFLAGLIDWLAKDCQLPIKIASTQEKPQSGIVYFPPEEKHLIIDETGKFVYSHAFPYDGHRPSVTITFKSVAQYYGGATLGVLLTGMGRDGAEGMLEITGVGGYTIAQDQASSVVFGMPKEAIALGGATEVLGINAIAPRILALCQHSPIIKSSS